MEATERLLLERNRELEAIDRLLRTARQGFSGALVLRGEAGIGKSVLVEHATGAASDFAIAHIAAVESEMELAYAGLHQLLVPFLSELDLLPQPQLDALQSALGASGGGSPDRFLVGLAVITRLAEVAVSRPLLCAIDDAHWLDRASAEVLAFAARRLLADRVAFLFAVRDPEGLGLPLDGLPSLTLRGLGRRASRELLAHAVSGSLDDAVARRLGHDTSGNPLALVELASELTPAQLAGEERLPDPVPVNGLLEQRFRSQARSLSTDAQTVLLIAAAEPSGDTGLLLRAAEELGVDVDALAEAEAEDLLVVGPTIAFRHPLIRSAVYHGATSAERRRVHRALAGAGAHESDDDRRAWHLAAAAIGADEQVAAKLERSAATAKRRGGYAAASATLVRAAS
jgi:predicted ATPase